MKSKNIIATMLLFVFVASVITSIPLVNINVQAQTTPTLVTYPIIDAIPNPIGVGQVTLLKTGISTTNCRCSKRLDWYNNNRNQTRRHNPNTRSFQNRLNRINFHTVYTRPSRNIHFNNKLPGANQPSCLL